MAIDDNEIEEERVEFDDAPDDVEYTDDGGAIVKIGDDEEEEDPALLREFYADISTTFPDSELQTLATTLFDDIERDKRSREKRDKQYAEAIKRTGLGKEAPGGADFEGASKVVHPMLTEACVDFSARAIRELMPPNGPAKSYVPGDDPPPQRIDKADRVTDYMNWQFLIQMPDFRTELEQLLTQLPLGGSQYMRLVHDMKRKRPVPTFWPVDDVYLPYSASNFYTAERVTFVEHITAQEFNGRVKSGMYRDIGDVNISQAPEQSEAEKATAKIEGKESIAPYNEDGLRDVFEVMCYCDLEDGLDNAPYRVTLDSSARKVVAINRNWEEDANTMEPMYWAVEFPFVPWRGAYSIGLGQMIGSLAGAATGALRALLDSAHMNNLPTLLRVKGANLSGQSKELNIGEVTEIEGGVAGDDDIRKLVMPVPFNPPSDTLMALLGFVTDAGRGVVQTTFEKLSDQNPNMPVGTTLALIEEGQIVFSAIHLRLFQSMNYVLRILSRINRMYIEDEEVENDLGEVLAKRADFDLPMDVVPVADPQIFSDVQRMAQLQIIADRAQAMPELYNLREVEKRLLERTKIPNADELLLPEELPEDQNAVNENAAMTLKRPVAAFPEQDHLAHLQVHLDYLKSPMFGSSPLMAPGFIPMVLDHITEHMALWYVTANYEALLEAIDGDEDELAQMMKYRDPETRKEMDQTLAAVSQSLLPEAELMLAGIPPVIEQAMQMMQQLSESQQPQIPSDPNAMAAIEASEMADQRKDVREKEKLQLTLVDKQEARKQVTENKFMELNAKDRQSEVTNARESAKKLAEYAARLEEILVKEAAEDRRTAEEIASREQINADDNTTALTIAAVDVATTGDTRVKTGESLTNPDPS